MIYTTEGAFEEILFILQKMRWLAEQAAKDTLTQQQREHIQLEIDSLKREIDRVAGEMQFNGTDIESFGVNDCSAFSGD